MQRYFGTWALMQVKHARLDFFVCLNMSDRVSVWFDEANQVGQSAQVLPPLGWIWDHFNDFVSCDKLLQCFYWPQVKWWGVLFGLYDISILLLLGCSRVCGVHGQPLAYWVWKSLSPQLYLTLNASWHDRMITFTLTRQVQPQLQWCYTNRQLVKAQHKTALAAGLHANTVTCNILMQSCCS